jgi:hypothetical protein
MGWGGLLSHYVLTPKSLQIEYLGHAILKHTPPAAGNDTPL